MLYSIQVSTQYSDDLGLPFYFLQKPTMTETSEPQEIIAASHGVTGFDAKTTYYPFPPGGKVNGNCSTGWYMAIKNSGSANSYF